jgi:hypothetical protein
MPSHHHVVKAIPFSTRLTAEGGAKNILARDLARAQNLLAGIQPHGPAAFHSAMRSRQGSTPSHTAPKGTTHPTPTTTVVPSPDSVSVVDAG